MKFNYMVDEGGLLNVIYVVMELIIIAHQLNLPCLDNQGVLQKQGRKMDFVI